MRIPRIFSPQRLTEGTTVRLGQREITHLGRVLRLKAGDAVVLFDGSGRDFEARITIADHRDMTIETGVARAAATESPLDVSLIQGMCRSHRMDTVMQKATELGVHRIQPVATERSVVRLNHARLDRKVSHWRRVAISACEQCGRSVIPGIPAPLALPQALGAIEAATVRLMLDPEAARGLGQLDAAGASIALLSGPEGGFTAAERALAEAAGFQRIRLGPRILRTETAPLAALSILQYLLGDLG